MEKEFTVNNLLNLLEHNIPLEWSEEWDNSGFQIGNPEDPVDKILVALNPDPPTISFAIENGYNVLITHHPLFFSGVKRLDRTEWPGNLIYRIIENGLNVISLHTNFDKAPFGISVNIARKLGWKIESPVIPSDEWGLGVAGKFENPMKIVDVVNRIKEVTGFSAVRFTGDSRREVVSYALCGGSCFSIVDEVLRRGVDLFVTSDVKYHDMMDSFYKGLPIISVDHSIEWIGFSPLVDLLDDWLKESGVSVHIGSFDDRLIKWY